MEAARLSTTAFLALCGLAIVILSFMTWVKFDGGPLRSIEPASASGSLTSEVSGQNTSIWRDREGRDAHTDAPLTAGWCSCEVSFGDGYLTAALGLGVVAAAAAASLLSSRIALLVSLLASGGVMVIAGFNAFADWSALVSAGYGDTLPTDGDVQPALYLLVAAGAIAAILAVTTWAAEIATEAEYDDEEDEDNTLDESDETMLESVMTWA